MSRALFEGMGMEWKDVGTPVLGLQSRSVMPLAQAFRKQTKLKSGKHEPQNFGHGEG